MTLFIAGHETTANALIWTFYLLSQHPAVNARLDQELAGVLAGRLRGSLIVATFECCLLRGVSLPESVGLL